MLFLTLENQHLTLFENYQKIKEGILALEEEIKNY